MNARYIYSSNPLNRCEQERRDEKWIAGMINNRSSKFLLLNDLNVLVSRDIQVSLGWIGVDDIRRLRIIDRVFLLGLRDESAFFAVDVSGNEYAIEELRAGGQYRFVDARRITEFLGFEDLGIVAQARAHVHWHNQNGFCSICGQRTFVIQGGKLRRCSKCNSEHYPRTDPVAITLVSDKDQCLLGQSRGRLSQTNTYSALAGFIEQGESIEEAVAREVMEEAGIRVRNIRYHSSQPWPFPSSLMIGCHADAATTEIIIDSEEMVDVRWFQRDEVLRALEGTSEILVVPGPIAIAHHLIKVWANNDI